MFGILQGNKRAAVLEEQAEGVSSQVCLYIV